MTQEDSKFMKIALELAEKARGFTSPNPLVGAVLVKDGQIVGEGWHKKAGLAHAEVEAIDNAKEKARGATLYVTLEPCNHTGKTPPCTKKIIEAGITKVVAATLDPNPNVAGNGLKYLEANNIEVKFGTCQDLAKKQNEIFFKYITTGLPFIIVKCASTLDGKIAAKTGDSKWITNEQSRAFVHKIRHSVDGIMVGIGTVKKDNPNLTARIEGFAAKNPVPIILDTNFDIDENANVFADSLGRQPIILCSDLAANKTDKKNRLEDKGARVIKCGLKDNLIDFEDAINKLGKLQITSILVEGGSRVIGSALTYADKIMFFYAPKILGGEGIPICTAEGPQFIKDCIKLKDIEIKRFVDDILIEGSINK